MPKLNLQLIGLLECALSVRRERSKKTHRKTNLKPAKRDGILIGRYFVFVEYDRSNSGKPKLTIKHRQDNGLSL